MQNISLQHLEFYLKCILLNDFTPSHWAPLVKIQSLLAGILKMHLKTHGGKVRNKWSQFTYLSSVAYLRRHMTTHAVNKQLSLNPMLPAGNIIQCRLLGEKTFHFTMTL